MGKYFYGALFSSRLGKECFQRPNDYFVFAEDVWLKFYIETIIASIWEKQQHCIFVSDGEKMDKCPPFIWNSYRVIPRRIVNHLIPSRSIDCARRQRFIIFIINSSSNNNGWDCTG